MKKSIILFLALTLCVNFIYPQEKRLTNETEIEKAERMQWWTNDRFGMFIHWGLYALPARHEWVKQSERLTTEQYQKYFEEFNPVNYDPVKWAKNAKKAGMKYAVLTSKHHEGFCLFDSKYTDYKATNTMANRDLAKEFVDAFRAEGLKVGFYYSLIDWHHPDFTIDRVHPQRTDSQSDYVSMNEGKDMDRYRTYLHNQVREILTNYGKIDILWLDFSYPGENGKGRDDWNSIELIKMARELQPGIIIDNRADLNDYVDGYDFETPEQVSPAQLAAYKGKYWETCQTFSGSWGYYRDETSWKTHRQLLDLLITSTANGGNLLLNVGPTAKGEFDYRANEALNELGYWMDAHSESIYNCTYAPDEFKLPDNINARLTYNPTERKLYLHLFDYPSSGIVTLSNYGEKIKYVQLLNDYSEIIYKQTNNNRDITLTLPKVKPPYEVVVIELILK
jgi:alpha-L-fucosidase